MPKEFLPQLTLTATIKENSAGGETLSFIVPLGPLQVICIANIPGDGEREAPAYVKFKLDVRDTQTWLNNKIGRPRPNFDEAMSSSSQDRPRFNRDDRPRFNGDDRPRFNGDDRPRFNGDDPSGPSEPNDGGDRNDRRHSQRRGRYRDQDNNNY